MKNIPLRRIRMAKITKEELIGLLNKDLGLEYTAMVQYTQHQCTLKGAMYQSIQKELAYMPRRNSSMPCDHPSSTDRLSGGSTDS
jgi:ferritin-like protein